MLSVPSASRANMEAKKLLLGLLLASFPHVSGSIRNVAFASSFV